MVGAGQVLSDVLTLQGPTQLATSRGGHRRRDVHATGAGGGRSAPAPPAHLGWELSAGVARGDRRQDGARCRGDGATWMMQTPLWPWPRPSRPQWRKRWWEVLSSPTAELRSKAHRLHAHRLTMRPSGTLKVWVPGAVARARLGLGELPRVPLQRSFSGQQRWLSSS